MSTWKCGCCGLYNNYLRHQCQACFHEVDEYNTIVVNNYKSKHETYETLHAYRPYLFVHGFIRELQNAHNSSLESIGYDIIYLIYLFFPSKYVLSTSDYQKCFLEDNLKLLKVSYDKETKQIYLSGKQSSNELNINQIYDSKNELWINFNNNPPYFWQIQCIVNCEGNKYCIVIAKDADTNLCYLLFNKQTLQWNKQINKQLFVNTDAYASTVRIIVVNAIIIENYSYLLLLLSKETYFDPTNDILEVQLFSIKNILEPRFVKKKEFKLDYCNYNIIKHPLFCNKLILFGGCSADVDAWKSFIDTFMVINIDINSLEIEEEIDFDFEEQFGAESIDTVLQNVLWKTQTNDDSYSRLMNAVANDFNSNMEYEYVGFGHCVVGYQLFLFGGYCQQHRINSILIYDFIRNEWKVSSAEIPKIITKTRAVFDENQNKIHLFASHKKHYRYHYILNLKQLC